jgi:hypothetical protein
MMDLLGKDGLGKEEELRKMWDETVHACKAKDSRITYEEFVLLMKAPDWKDIQRDNDSGPSPSSVHEPMAKLNLNVTSESHEAPVAIRDDVVSHMQQKSQSSSSSETADTVIIY